MTTRKATHQGGTSSFDNDDEMQELVVVGSTSEKKTNQRQSKKITTLLGALLFLTVFCLFILYSRGFAGLDDDNNKATTEEKDVSQAIKQLQIENFRQNKSTFLNFHITHHGGTTVCREVGFSLTHPSASCWLTKPEDNVPEDYPFSYPWTHNETAKNLAMVRQYFQFISWEYRSARKIPNRDTDWENPNLVSLLIMREPVSRALAGDGLMNKKFPNLQKNASEEMWWEFAQQKDYTNNYALRILTDQSCCNGSSTDRHYLEDAKALVRRFTFVLDIACLQHGLDKMAELLGFQLRHHAKSRDGHHATAKEKIPYPKVYDYLVEKNKVDIELYEWSKTISLVNCDAVFEEEEEAAKQQQQESTKQEEDGKHGA